MTTVQITTLTDQNTCSFCNNALAKYACPRCDQLYCTLTCYQSEQHQICSEQFYKEMVEEHLQLQLGDETNKVEKMQEILKRFHEANQLAENLDDANLDSDDDAGGEAVDDLGTRLSGINLDDSEQVWKHLTEAERKDFEAFLQSTDASQFVEMWKPWWEYKSTGVLDEDEWNTHKTQCPDINEIQRFTAISTKPPANCVENNLINVLAAYTFLQRYFNGEVTGCELEFTTFLWYLSLNLKDNVNFDTAAIAIESIFQQCLTCVELNIAIDKENKQHVKSDVNAILAGPHVSERKFYLLSALSDCKSLLLRTRQGLSKKAETPQNSGEFYAKFTAQQSQAVHTFTKEKIKQAARKVNYYLSFVQDMYLKS